MKELVGKVPVDAGVAAASGAAGSAVGSQPTGTLRLRVLRLHLPVTRKKKVQSPTTNAVLRIPGTPLAATGSPGVPAVQGLLVGLIVVGAAAACQWVVAVPITAVHRLSLS